MVRCFIGFLLPENIKKYVTEIEVEIGKLPIVCKLVEVENLHICMSFLGEVNENEIEGIVKKLDEICENYNKFDVMVSEIKTIPNENYIRVLALDVLERTGVIKEISKEVVQKIGGDSKPPHLTLCRVKNISDKKNVVEKLREIKKEYKTFNVSAIQLIKSELRRTGPVYSIIHGSSLKD